MKRTSLHKNILFLIADDWSPLAACYGNDVIQTPHIDQFARQSVVFDHAFCTSPSCAVSRASILTGQHSHTHGQYGHCHGLHHFQTFAHMQSTPGVLKEHGYVSAIIGKGRQGISQNALILRFDEWVYYGLRGGFLTRK